jgi:cell fate regulator YaaT (PSP1 superfamily)
VPNERTAALTSENEFNILHHEFEEERLEMFIWQGIYTGKG